jgi:signal transduction histidine kinase
MIKRIVENAGGKIEVKSRINIGTTFKVYLTCNK